MKNTISKLLFVIMLSLFTVKLVAINFQVTSTNAIESTENDTIAELKAIAEEAYLYGFPMIVGYKVMYDFNIDKNSAQFKAPFNVINNEARVFTPADTSVSTPNSDTPYSILQMDLRTEPIVLCMPEIEKERYYDVQLVDLYTDNYGYMGSRTTGNGAGCYLVAGPDWDGKTPKGIDKVFRCETQFSLAVYRTQLFNPEDMDNVKKIQAGYKVQPLSEFLGQPAPPAAPSIDWPEFSQAAFTTEFGKYLSFLLQFCPPNGTAAVEIPLREKFAKIGIVAGGEAKPAKPLSPQMKEALGEAVKAAFAKIEYQANNIGKVVNGWHIGSATGNREYYNGNWTLRAAAAKIGIYGNDAQEAAYPYTRSDVNGLPLDCSKHNYVMTFKEGELPPVHAFWSVTMYNSQTQMLINNPINRYLINSPMLPQLKKNIDGSISIYIQHESPGKDKESNWLPAPDGLAFIAMRMYWPKTEPPSVFPLGEGTWAPPGIIPVTNLDAMGVTRFGDLSVENVVRTDERYGHDGLFQGPRGWYYWNYLEYPKPIQNPNLWPDMHSTYFLSRLKLPKGSSLTFKGSYPYVRYMKFALYKSENNTFVSIGEDIAGMDIQPDKGSVNPFQVGAQRLLPNRDFTITLLAQDPPKDNKDRKPNTLYVGTDEAELEMVLRIYLPNQGKDGAGWGHGDYPFIKRGLPSYEGTLADGTKLNSDQVIEKFVIPFESNTKQPVTDQQWTGLVNSTANVPGLNPTTAPATKVPKWEKYWTFKYSIVGSFKSEEERAKIPYAGAIDGGGDPATQYLFLWLSREYGDVYVMKGKMPTFPNTYSGAGETGLAVMPDAQTQYFSIVSCEAAPSGRIVDGLADFQIPLDENGYYTIVYSRKEDRPSNATAENGVAWIEWSPRGEGLESKDNREDFGMLMIRIMATNPNWKERPDNVTKPGMEEEIMGPYFPVGEYTDKATFEASGTK
ncbi:MAG TPA: DUF1254 domain-containing protein [Bacteroidales bacterium]